MKSISPSYHLIVANFDGSVDSLGNPVAIRTKFTEQLVYQHEESGNTVGRLSGSVSNSTGTLTISDNDFSTGVSKILLGDYKFLSGVHFAQGVDADATATTIASMINNLPEFSASANTNVVTITGLSGPFSDKIPFQVFYYGTIVNFTLVPTTKYLTGGGPGITAPVIS